MSASAIALNRFGLGSRPDEPAPAEPQRWLLSQLDAYEPLPRPGSRCRARPRSCETWLAQQRAVRQAPEGQRSGIREAYLRAGARCLPRRRRRAHRQRARSRSTPFVERLVHFWSNHFAVSVDKLLVVGLAGGFEADAIRPHVLGRFEDLLLAVVRHPAMLLYLDQAQSIGPGSLAGMRAGRAAAATARPEREPGARDPGAAHARRAQRLHAGGRHRVRARADRLDAPGRRCRCRPARRHTFRFVPALHEPGARTVLGRSYADGGEQQARAILHDLATAPATARHIATKLARHFVADEPPPRWCNAWRAPSSARGGDLPSVYRELVASPRGVAAGERQVQVAVGLGRLQPARAGAAGDRPRRRRRT